MRAVAIRALKIYNRSPSYNLNRMLVAGIMALLFSTVYASQKVPQNESDMNSRINSVFVSTIFLCVIAQNQVLRFFECEVS
jgi:ABC-type uncharacterized transport system permease subunit